MKDRNPLYWDTYEILNENIMVRPITINLLHSRAMLNTAFIRLNGDWKIYEDIKGRPGFISTVNGSKSSFYLAPDMTQGLTQWIVHIDALKSYEHMSCLVVSHRIGEMGELHHNTFNMQWDEKVSQHSIIELVMNKPMKTNTNNSPSIFLEIMNSYCNSNSNNNNISTKSVNNKIKAFAITIY